MILTDYLQSIIQKGVRLLTLNRFGQTMPVFECLPYGYDSVPIKGVKVIWSNTSKVGNHFAIGCIPTQQVVNEGETRLYSTDATGNFKYNIWLTDDANLLLGTSIIKTDYIDNLVKYTELNTQLQSLITNINENYTLIATGMNAIIPDSYVPVDATIDFSNAKINNIKVQ